MLNINLEQNLDFYTDYEIALEYLKNIDSNKFEYPKDITYFHAYSEIQNRKELMVVKSFLATQDLNKSKLILWSDYDVKNNELLKPYKDLIEMRVYKPFDEAKGTLLENKREYLTASDEKHYMQSGILRFLMLYKYGGIWADMDMVFLRDFKPILNQDFAYMWGSSRDFEKANPNSGDCFGPCAALMGAIKGGEHISICMEELARTGIRPCTTCFDEDLLAKVYRRKRFTVFPSAFFDTEWQIGVKSVPLNQAIQAGWFAKNSHSNYLFLEAFAWHWHNTSRKYEDICEGSKFYLLENYIDDRLKVKGIL